MSEQIKQRELNSELSQPQTVAGVRENRPAPTPTVPGGIATKTKEVRRRRKLQKPGPVVWVAMILLLVVAVAAALADLITPINTEKLTFLTKLKPPFWMEGADSQFPLGTDAFGHDILTYLTHGARTSLIVGLIAPTIGALIGVSLGLLAGVKGKRIETVIMRAVDIQISFPFLVLALVLVAIFKPSMFSLLGVLSLAGWAFFARVARGEVKQVKAKEFVQAAEALGIPGRRIALRHVLPNIMASIIVLWTFQVGTIIIAEASLSFLGLGIPQPAVSWGGMINDGRNYLDTNWWVPFWPSLTLTLVVISINTVGDWVRDVLDPTTRR